MTLATAVTLLRIVVLPPLAFLILLPHHTALSLALFGGAAATDWADGVIARRWNQVTPLGARLDALIDKVFISALLLLLWRAGVFLWPIVAGALARDVFVQLMRTSAPAEQPVPANRWGKLKFLLQCVAIASAILALDQSSTNAFDIGANLALVGAILVSLPGVLLVLRQRLHTQQN